LKAVGLDTSIILRLLTGLPENQAKMALDQLRVLAGEKRKPLVSDLVVCEAYFALTYHYEVPKQEALENLLDLLESGVVFPDPDGAALQTLKSEEKTKAGFPDRLIRAQYLEMADEVLTFDADFGKMERVRRLKV
jgi:predicted nucleic-acid-binding protein